MKRRSFGVSSGGGLKELTEAEALEVAADSCAWIDVQEYDTTELTSWLKTLGCDRDIVRACADLSGRTRIHVSGADVFFEFPALASFEVLQRVPLGFLCRPGLCITLHPAPMAGLSQSVEHVLANSPASGTEDVSFLVAVMLAGLSSRAVDAVEDVRGTVRAMQEQLDRDPDGVEPEEIQEQSSAVRTLEGVVGERVIVFDRLQLLDTQTLDLSGHHLYRVALADAQYLDRAIDRLEKRITDLRVRFSLDQQDRTNRRLAVLTVISAVFLPLTLLAGIYGMNFEFMPELGYHYAYFLALGAMAAIAIGLIHYFRSRGWLE
jgi:magnesium transporter